MNNLLKKILTVGLCSAMVFSLVACGSGTQKTSSKGKKEAEATDQVKEPVKIEFWHIRGAGNNADNLNKQVERFNKTNQYGITVVPTYQGGYFDILSKVTTSKGTKTAPQLVVLGAGGIESLANANALKDLSGYVKRDNYNLENIPKSLRYYTQHYEDKIIEFPYLVSTAVIYYNKAFYQKEPASIEEWASMAKEITAKNSKVYGMGLTLDTGFIQRPILKSLGAPGLTKDNGEAPATLDDGSLKTFMTDWNKWIKDGYCMGLTVTDSYTNMRQKFMSGNLAALTGSSAEMTNMLESCKKSGIDLGIAKSVGYKDYAAAIGGGGLCVLDSATQQQTAACWEFIKFLLQDDQIAENYIDTGYLPFTYSAMKSKTVADFWKQNPLNQVPCDQLEYATYNDWSVYLQEWRDQMTNCFTSVLIDGSMTPDEAVTYLKRQATTIFP